MAMAKSLVNSASNQHHWGCSPIAIRACQLSMFTYKHIVVPQWIAPPTVIHGAINLLPYCVALELSTLSSWLSYGEWDLAGESTLDHRIDNGVLHDQLNLAPKWKWTI